MKRISPALLCLSLCLLMIGCATEPAPLDISKAWTVKELVDPGASPFGAVINPQNGQRFIAIELESKSDAEIKLDFKDLVLKDSAGASFIPIGNSAPNLVAFSRFSKSERGRQFISLGDKGAKIVLIYESAVRQHGLSISDFRLYSVAGCGAIGGI